MPLTEDSVKRNEDELIKHINSVTRYSGDIDDDDSDDDSDSDNSTGEDPRRLRKFFSERDIMISKSSTRDSGQREAASTYNDHTTHSDSRQSPLLLSPQSSSRRSPSIDRSYNNSPANMSMRFADTHVSVPAMTNSNISSRELDYTASRIEPFSLLRPPCHTHDRYAGTQNMRSPINRTPWHSTSISGIEPRLSSNPPFTRPVNNRNFTHGRVNQPQARNFSVNNRHPERTGPYHTRRSTRLHIRPSLTTLRGSQESRSRHRNVMNAEFDDNLLQRSSNRPD